MSRSFEAALAEGSNLIRVGRAAFEKNENPFLGEKLPWGLVPHVQALLLARMLRGDVDAYPPFLWK